MAEEMPWTDEERERARVAGLAECGREALIEAWAAWLRDLETGRPEGLTPEWLAGHQQEGGRDGER